RSRFSPSPRPMVAKPPAAMEAGITGPLVLVDISGYTTFVAETELTHSQILVAELLDAVLQSLGAHLEVSRLEGDAVFFVGDKTGPEPMDWFDQTYVASHPPFLKLVADRAGHPPS